MQDELKPLPDLGRNNVEVEVATKSFYETLSAEAEALDREISEDIGLSKQAASARNYMLLATALTIVVSKAKVEGKFEVFGGGSVTISDLSERLSYFTLGVTFLMVVNYCAASYGEYLSERQRREKRRRLIVSKQLQIEQHMKSLDAQIKKAQKAKDPLARERLAELESYKPIQESQAQNIRILNHHQLIGKIVSIIAPPIAGLGALILAATAAFWS